MGEDWAYVALVVVIAITVVVHVLSREVRK